MLRSDRSVASGVFVVAQTTSRRASGAQSAAWSAVAVHTATSSCSARRTSSGRLFVAERCVAHEKHEDGGYGGDGGAHVVSGAAEALRGRIVQVGGEGDAEQNGYRFGAFDEAWRINMDGAVCCEVMNKGYF